MRDARHAADLRIVAAAVATVVLLTAIGALVAPADAPYDRGSSLSAGPDGAKAAYLLLEELGYAVERSFEPVSLLDRDPAATLLVLASPTHQGSDQDRRALRRQLDAGLIVLATGTAGGLLPDTGHTLQTARPDPWQAGDRLVPTPALMTYQRVLPGALTRGVPTIRLEPDVALPPTGPRYAAAYSAGASPGVMVASIGPGRVIWWAGASPLLNEGIGRSGSAELLLNAIGPPGARTVIWDEFYHGHRRSLWSYLGGTLTPFALAQVTLIGAAALFTFGRRHTPPRPLVRETRSSPLEFVDTMAGLYRRASAAAAAVAASRSRARHLLLAFTGHPARSSDRALAAAAARRRPFDADEVRRLLERSDVSPEAPMDESDAIAIVRELQALSAQLAIRATGPSRPS